MAVLRNVKVKWCSVLEPNTMFEPVWQVDVILNKEQEQAIQKEAKEIYSKGLKIKTDDDGDRILRVQRKVYKVNGDDNNPPVCKDVVKDENGKLKDFDKLIGNGSVCNVQYGLFFWENKFGKGIGVDFKGIQVVEHVPYGIQDGEEFEALDENQDSSNEDDEGFDDEEFD